MATAENTRTGLGQRLYDFAARLEDGAVLRAAFLAMLFGTVGVLVIDYMELSSEDTTAPPAYTPEVAPILPAVDRPESDPDNPAYRPAERITTEESVLRAPMTISLQPGGVLKLEGAIGLGSAEALATEIAERGEYVEAVTLNSPGGLVDEALAMGRMIREAGFATSVGAGHLCGSSCPLVFAGGVTRTADPAASIGVHQIYAGGGPAGLRPEQALSDAQTTTAGIVRYLDGMGVDPALWIHALETPPDRLYYLSPDELVTFRLTTTEDSRN